MDPTALASVVAELQPLLGGRVQRVDLVRDRELVLELRYPGRTIRLLASARSGSGRVHVIGDRPPREVPGGDLQRALRKRLEGRPLVAITADRHTVELDLRDARISLRIDGGKDALQILPPSGRPVPSLPEPDRLPTSFPISERLAAENATREPESAAERLRGEVARLLRTRRQKLEKLALNLGRDRDRLQGLLELRRRGELLKPLLAERRGRARAGGLASVEVMDWEAGAPVQVPLDPTLGIEANMERFFTRARKAARGLPIVAERLQRVEAELAGLAALSDEARSADLDRLVELAEEAGARAGRVIVRGLDALPGERVVKGQEEQRAPIDRWSRRFSAEDGTEIRVGKGARENDRLTLSGARPDDYWLHASGTAGAHVILRVQRGQEPGREALLDAAQLAAHYSGAATSAKVEVVYTQARYVKKRKGDPPGRVGVSKARTLYVTIDPKRIDRLFGRG